MGEMGRSGSAGYVESIILSAAAESNILPLTSACNVRCLFCSHRQNPPEVEAFRISPRSRAEVARALSFMDPARPVVIGESVTRIMEGEPFTHPGLAGILVLVRATLPGTPIRITTNGSLLDEEKVVLLSRLGGVEVYLSMNSAREAGRAVLMADPYASRAVQSPSLLREHGVPFHGSVVAVPHLLGWDDLEETIKYLGSCGAATVRVFLPGFTRLAPPALRFEESLWERLHAFLLRLRREVAVPLTCEPPLLDGLEPEVAGVMAGSPAEEAGVRSGDVIETVDGLSAGTRVQAFRAVLQAASPELRLRRGEKLLSLRIAKGPGERSGLVMDYDLDPSLIADLARAVRRRGAKRVLVLTSRLAGPFFKMGLRRFWQGEAEVDLLEVPSVFFGGSIKAAGLLTVADFRQALEEHLPGEYGNKAPLVLLPGLAFDKKGRDLTRRSYLELQERFGLTFEVL